MNKTSIAIAVVTLLLTATVGVVVFDAATDGFESDEVCAAEWGDGWTYTEGPDDTALYCQAPNGTVHETIVNMGGPVMTLEELPAVFVILTITVGVTWLFGRSNGASAR